MWPFLLLAVFSLAYGLGLDFVAGRISASGLSLPGLSRKVFHIGIFSGAAPAHLVLGFWGVVTYGSVLSGLILVGIRRGPGWGIHDRLARPGGEDSEMSVMLRPFISTALGGLLGAILVGDLAVVGYLVCGWGDGAGALVGRRFGRRWYRSPFGAGQGKVRSLEGSVAVFLVGTMGGFVALLLLGYGLAPAVMIGSVCGFAGAVAEGVSGHDTDNFWVQVLPSLMAWWLAIRVTVQ